MTIPLSAEPGDCLGVRGDPGTASKKLLSTVLSGDALEYQPVYNDYDEDQNYSVYESFQEKGAKARLPNREQRGS